MNAQPYVNSPVGQPPDRDMISVRPIGIPYRQRYAPTGRMPGGSLAGENLLARIVYCARYDRRRVRPQVCRAAISDAPNATLSTRASATAIVEIMPHASAHLCIRHINRLMLLRGSQRTTLMHTAYYRNGERHILAVHMVLRR